MRTNIRECVRTCDTCQESKRKKMKYGELPPQEAKITPWKNVCADLIGPYTLHGKEITILDFMCLMMIDPAMGYFKII